IAHLELVFGKVLESRANRFCQPAGMSLELIRASRRILIYQHMASDSPGLIGKALLRKGVATQINYLYQGEAVRDPSGYDALIVMGGEMNVYQEEQFPWLAVETRFVRQAALGGQAILGICLGGQLLARALGA